MNVSTEVIFTEYLRGSSANADWRTVDQERATHCDAFARSRFPETNIATGQRRVYRNLARPRNVALRDNETAEDASQLGSFGGIAVSPPSFQKGAAGISYRIRRQSLSTPRARLSLAVIFESVAIRWIVIGVGDITTKRVLPAILAEPRSLLAGIVTRTPAKAKPYGVPAWTSLDVALAEQECDAVYVASPVILHAPQTIASLRAGRHVLCEKPMAMKYEDAFSMQRTADEVGRILGIAYYRRMYPQVIRALELIRLKAIGEPVFAEATSHSWFCPGPEDERSWFIDPAMAGGGPLYDIASHRIDLMNYLFGNPVRATAHLSNAVHQYAVEDNATVMVEYNSGVRGVIDVRWHSRVLRDEFRIRGTDGEIEMTPLNSGVLIYPGGKEELPPHENLHYPCVEDFVSAVLAGTEPRSSGATALATAWVTDEAIRLPNGRKSYTGLRVSADVV